MEPPHPQQKNTQNMAPLPTSQKTPHSIVKQRQEPRCYAGFTGAETPPDHVSGKTSGGSGPSDTNAAAPMHARKKKKANKCLHDPMRSSGRNPRSARGSIDRDGSFRSVCRGRSRPECEMFSEQRRSREARRAAGLLSINLSADYLGAKELNVTQIHPEV